MNKKSISFLGIFSFISVGLLGFTQASQASSITIEKLSVTVEELFSATDGAPLNDGGFTGLGDKPTGSGDKPSTPAPTTPAPTTNGSGTNTSTTQNNGSRNGPFSGIDLDKMATIGNKIWEFMVSHQPDATYNTLSGSVVPGGVKSWTELSGWKMPVTKIYKVTFNNLFGLEVGSFEYRINFIYGGGYQGVGQYIGQISFAPRNIQLKTDRKVNIKAELLQPVNFGTVENPLAGVQLLVTWNSPTSLRYEMGSTEFLIMGNGQIMNLTNEN